MRVTEEQLQERAVEASLVELSSNTSDTLDKMSSYLSTPEVVDRDGIPLQLGNPIFILTKGVYSQDHRVLTEITTT